MPCIVDQRVLQPSGCGRRGCSWKYLDLQSGTFTGSGAGLPTPAFFWIWSGAFSKSLYVDSQGLAFFVVCISLKVNPLLMQ